MPQIQNLPQIMLMLILLHHCIFDPAIRQRKLLALPGIQDQLPFFRNNSVHVRLQVAEELLIAHTGVLNGLGQTASEFTGRKCAPSSRTGETACMNGFESLPLTFTGSCKSLSPKIKVYQIVHQFFLSTEP
ncbi:hypothetical protein D3C73_1126230 [compost metagenome]